MFFVSLGFIDIYRLVFMSIHKYVADDSNHLNYPISNYFESDKHFNNKRSYEQVIIKTNDIQKV